MKVKLLVSRAGVSFAQNAGDVIDVADAEGLSLIKSGQADTVVVKETAAKKTVSEKRKK